MSLSEESIPNVRAQRGAKGALTAVGIGLVALLILFFVGREVGAYVPRFVAWVASLGFWGPLVFIVGYAIATVAFVPGLVLTMAAGAIFGIVNGVLYVMIAASIGATAAFLISRYVARSAVEQRLAGNAKFAAVDQAIGREGLKIVTLLRLSPVFPFNLLNYALGLTKVRLRDYVIACGAMLPGSLLYVYSGKLAGELAAVAGGAGLERGPGYWALLGIGLVATAVVTTVVTRIARRALRQQMENEQTESAERDSEGAENA